MLCRQEWVKAVKGGSLYIDKLAVVPCTVYSGQCTRNVSFIFNGRVYQLYTPYNNT